MDFSSSILKVFFLNVLLVKLLLLKSINGDMGCIGRGDKICSLCNCSDNISSVNCSHRGLVSLSMALPENLTFLDLSYNFIGSFNINTFKSCWHLERLNLSFNQIYHLQGDLFRDLGTSLVELKLQHNALYLEDNSYIFSPLNQSLEMLYIQANQDISQHVFTDLSALKKLAVSGNVTGGFGPSFSNLRSLKYLRVFSPLKSITNSTFWHLENCTNLEYLDIRDVGLDSIDKKAFKPLKFLRNLDLGYNRKLNLKDVARSLHSLPKTIEVLNLTYLIGDQLPTLNLTRSICKIFKRLSSLKHLKLDKNQLLYINQGFQSSLEHLESLDISYNRLVNVFALTALSFTLVNLTYINADDQSKRPTVDEKYEGEEQDPIETGGNGLVGNFRKHRGRVKYRYSKEECVAKIATRCRFPDNSRAIWEDSWCIPCPRSLKIARTSGVMNENLEILPSILFLGDCQVSECYFGNNGIRIGTGPFIIDRPMAGGPILFDLSFNGMVCLAPNVLELSIKRGLVIGTFILEGNDLSEQLGKDEDGDTFSNYINLTELNLANNKLKVLHTKSFRNLHNLEILNLSRNSLQILEFEISHMKNLKALDLSNNLFAMFSDSNIDVLGSMSIERGFGNFVLHILGNPLQCSCEATNFIHALIGMVVKIDKFEEVTCFHKSSIIFLEKTESIERNLVLYCYYALPLIITGTLAGLLIICTFIGVVAYKYRWDIRYYMLRVSQNRMKYQVFLDQMGDYLYDAFVSYDADDRSWVVQHLIPNLERPDLNTNRNGEKHQKHTEKTKLLHNDERLGYDYGTPGETSTLQISNSDMEDGGEIDHFEDEEFFNLSMKFQLCVHERDFDPGRGIEASILNAIQQSRKVILAVSESFIKSKWCRLELEVTKMESLDRGRNIAVVVFLEPVEEKLESLEWLMKRYTYLEWFKCDTNSKKQEFWKRLKVALGKISSEKVTCECGR